MILEPWAIAALYSILVTICMAVAAFICICGCRAKERKDELVGIEGHVKMTNPEVLQDVRPNEIHVVDGVGDRVTAVTAKRSLPDLPVVDHPEADVATADGLWEPSGDTVSELYATVGNQKSLKPGATSALILKEHPYDKLKGVEHPYAQVNITDAPSTSQESATMPPSPRHNATAPLPTRDIAAAPAIAGHVHASDDLPYMTPPTHFSGDSQDSAKGYTSISVREPLATIRAETAEVRGEREETRDRHYATVSDDSDDMYAAIEEPANGSETYAQIRPAPPPVDNLRTTSAPANSHSHSRQESSSSAASSVAVQSPKPEKRQANSPLPAPPAPLAPEDQRTLDDMYAKVNKKRRRDVEEVLERGASTESAVSGSSESVSYRLQSNNISTTDSSHSSQSCHGQSTTSSSTTDGSAPNERESQLASVSHSTHSCASHSTTESPSSRHFEASDSSLSSDLDARASYERLSDDPRYETLGKKATAKRDPGYETLDRVGKDPGYATLSKVSDDPCYATVRKSSDPGYETLHNGESALLESSDLDSEPNYETLEKGPPSDSDPNYERIGQDHDYASLKCSRPDNLINKYPPPYAEVVKHRTSEPSYSEVRKHRVELRTIEPPYTELVKHTSEGELPYSSLDGHAYAEVRKLSEAADEPPYSSLDRDGFISEPDYESVQYSSGHIDPPYQILADFESGFTHK